jgi:3-hydroxybutyryl-CoA dehydrogenase
MKETIAIIGAGLMGRGLSQVFAIPGHRVRLYDAYPDALNAAKGIIAKELALAVEAGLLEPQEPQEVLARISTYADLAQVVDGARLVVECVPENMALKQQVFKTLDELCPVQVILASNTSAMSITEIASQSVNKNRIVGTHFWNPPHLLPLVEVVQTVDTSADTVKETLRILTEAGKKAIHVKKDVPGFVANRMQHALWREAFHILDEGIADAATIDKAVRYSFGLRLPVLAPMENADMVGVDLTYAIHDYLLPYLADNKTPSAIVTEKMKKGELGFKSNGVGIQTFSPEQIAASRTTLSRYLMDVAARRRRKQFCGD